MSDDQQNSEKGKDPVVVGVWLGRGRREKKRGCGESNFQSGMLAGGIIVLIGLAFLLDNMGIFPIGRIFFFWPTIMIAAGVLNLVSRSNRMWGVLLIFAGILFELNMLGIAHFRWSTIWPMVLIAVGVMVIWNSLESQKIKASTGDPRTTLNEMAIFGGIERRVTSPDFRGGQINAIFGGVELDLSEATMQQEEAILEVNAIFGGVEIRVPDSWQVVSRGTPIFGGYDDKSRLRAVQDPASPTHKLLILTGGTIFGGVEIKN